jgi:hypothetical protein
MNQPKLTIIIDSTTLLALSLKIKTDSGEDLLLLDVLENLAQRGVRIIIPEMVAIETCRRCIKGSIEDLFPKNSNPPQETRRFGHDDLDAFMERAFHKETKGISIGTTDSDSEVSKYVAETNRIIGDFLKVKSSGKQNRNRDVRGVNPERYFRMMATEHQNKPTDNFGEYHAHEIAKGLRLGEGEQVFFLSHDVDALRGTGGLRLRSGDDLIGLHTSTFLDVLCDTEVMEQLGKTPPPKGQYDREGFIQGILLVASQYLAKKFKGRIQNPETFIHIREINRDAFEGTLEAVLAEYRQRNASESPVDDHAHLSNGNGTSSQRSKFEARMEKTAIMNGGQRNGTGNGNDSNGNGNEPGNGNEHHNPDHTAFDVHKGVSSGNRQSP